MQNAMGEKVPEGTHMDEARGKAPGKEKKKRGADPVSALVLRSWLPFSFLYLLFQPLSHTTHFAELASLPSSDGGAFRYRLRTYLCDIQSKENVGES